MSRIGKKNAIRFGAVAIAILIFGGAFSVWALSTQATATAGVGDVDEDIGIESINTPGDVEFEDTFAGRPGEIDGGNLFTIEFDDNARDAYSAVVYLAETDLEGLRTFAMDFGDGIGNLTLENGRVEFEIEDTEGSYDINVNGGFYHAHPFQDLPDDIQFMIDIEPVV